MCCDLYNACIEQRRIAWKNYRVSISRFDQNNEITKLRHSMSEYRNIYSSILQNVTHRVDLSFKKFFNKNYTVGFPRFKTHSRYHSFTYPNANNTNVKFHENSRISLSKTVYNIKVKIHTPIEGNIKTATIHYKASKWYLIITVDNAPPRYIHGNGEIGIDFGLKTSLTLSNSKQYENIKIFKKNEDKIKKLQQNISRKKKGSNRWYKCKILLQKLHIKISASRLLYIHTITKEIVTKNGKIAIENLDISNMIKTTDLAKQIHDVAWGKFISILEYKAEEAGALVLKVNPAYTSQECSSCGKIVPKELSERIHSCSCGLTLDRDHNAALNILKRAQLEPSWRNYDSSSMKREVNLID